MQHYTFSSNSKDLKELNAEVNEQEKPKSARRFLNSNFLKSKTRFKNEFEGKNCKINEKDSIIEPESNLLAPAKSSLQKTFSLSASNRALNGKFSGASVEKSKSKLASSQNPYKKDDSEMASNFEVDFAGDSEALRTKQRFIPKHLLERSGWNFFLSQSCKNIGQNGMEN